MQQDNGNVEFSYNCLKWMAAGPGGPRTKVLFVEDGKINAKFDVPLKEVPDELLNRIADFLARHLEPLIRRKAESLEEQARSFDEQEWFNDHHVSPRQVLRALLVVLAVLVVLYGCWKVGWKARYRSDLQGPLLASALHRLAPSGAVVDERRRALVRGNNLWEPARDLARQCLAEAGARPGAGPPPVAVHGGWLRRWTTAGRLERLWRLAYGPPVRVPLDEWRRLLRRSAGVEGRLRRRHGTMAVMSRVRNSVAPEKRHAATPARRPEPCRRSRPARRRCASWRSRSAPCATSVLAEVGRVVVGMEARHAPVPHRPAGRRPRPARRRARRRQDDAVQDLRPRPRHPVPAPPVHARPAAVRRDRHLHLRPQDRTNSCCARGRSSARCCWPTRSTAPPPRRSRPCWRRCRKTRSPSRGRRCRCRSRSWCWRRRTPSSRKASTACRRRSSTASCCASRWAIPAARARWPCCGCTASRLREVEPAVHAPN